MVIIGLSKHINSWDNMDDQKLENLLNLALSATEEERIKSQNLNIGYDEINKTWEVIVKYNGDISFLNEMGIDVVFLLGQYAILTLDESKILYLSKLDEIIYIEKPKRLFFQIENGKRASCINSLQTKESSNTNSNLNNNQKNNLYGAGVILGFADSGIDYNHPLFKNKDNSSKILEIWDQTSAYGNPPSGYSIGTVFTKEQLESNNSLPTKDLSGHGTHVAGIASAVAPESQIIMVKLGTQRANSFPRTSELMQAVDYLVTERN